jgi:agmatinase
MTSFDPDAPARPGALFGLPHTPADAALVVVPVPFEATASYGRGTSGAPEAVLAASAQVDLTDLETGEPWRAGMAMEAIDPQLLDWNDEASALALDVIEAGGAVDPESTEKAARVNAIGARLNTWVYAHTRALLDAGKIPAILGGDHSVPFGAIQAAAETYPGLGVLHIDAHADLRAAYEGFTWSHASIFHNVKTRLPAVGPLVQVGIRDVGAAELAFARERDDVWMFTDPELAWELAGDEPWLRICARIVRPLPRDVWVSFDIDGLEPSLCPGTGTPVPGGLRWRDALLLLRVLSENGHRIVGFDLCEVGAGEWDANVGARLLYKLAGWAIQSRNNTGPRA